jgi:hypothetical protein
MDTQILIVTIYAIFILKQCFIICVDHLQCVTPEPCRLYFIEIVSPAEPCVKVVYSCYQLGGLEEHLCRWPSCMLCTFTTRSTSCHFGKDGSMECIDVYVGIH